MKLQPSIPKEMCIIKYSTKDESIKLEKAHTKDSGYDIAVSLKGKPIVLEPGDYKTIKTGLFLSLPENVEGQIRPRSGLANKFGVTILNSPGTIDSGYTGEINVIMINHGKNPYEIRDKDRIAQIVFAKIIETETEQIKNIESIGKEAERGDQGLGSTDTK